MPKQLDVYRDWLGIQEPARPLNHYQLLRLKQFEDDPAKVREHYRKMNAHIRKFAAGDYAKESQDLLNELAKAMLCLTDARRKGEYDASLGRRDVGTGRRRSLEEILLGRKLVEPAQLDKARNYATAVGVEMRDALVQQRVARPEVVIPAYAESIGVPYLDLADIQLDADLASQVPAVLARQHSCVPVMIDDRQLLMASPNLLDPNVEEELRLRFGMPVRSVLCTPGGIHEAIEKFYSREVAAAQKAAGVAPRAATATKASPAKKAEKAAAAPQVEAAPAEARPARAPLSSEAKAQRKKITVIVFNFTVMFTFLGYQFGYGQGILLGLAIAFGAALITAGITWTALGMQR